MIIVCHKTLQNSQWKITFRQLIFNSFFFKKIYFDIILFWFKIHLLYSDLKYIYYIYNIHTTYPSIKIPLNYMLRIKCGWIWNPCKTYISHSLFSLLCIFTPLPWSSLLTSLAKIFLKFNRKTFFDC